MSIMDQVIAAVTPPESAEQRAKAQASATPGDWLARHCQTKCTALSLSD